MRDELTDAERALVATLPGPPKMAQIRTSNVWIVEWLPADEPNTGRTLHEWMNERRQGWSAYFSCQTKKEVIAAIAYGTEHAQRNDMRPVLHIEAHGDDAGLEGPDGCGGTELLTWDELTEPLQRLNLATRCNLVVVVAACTGFAGVQALQRGPRAPAVALVGPDAPVMPSNLLWGAKEFYRCWLDENPRLAEIAESASREAGTVTFEWEPFAILAYDAFVESLIKSMRPVERRKRMERLRRRMLSESGLPNSAIDKRLATMPPLPPWEGLQQAWNEMFMIDLYPTNQERFGLDLRTIVNSITRVVPLSR